MMTCFSGKRVGAVCLGLLVWLTVDAAAVAGEGYKVGIIDTAKIVMNSRYGQQIKAEFAAEMEEQRKILDKKRQTMEKQQQKLAAAKEAGKSAAVIQKQEEELEKMVREFKWLKEDFDKELRETDKALLEKMKKRVRLVLDQFVVATDYCIIIDKQRVAAFCVSADVTDEFIKWLDSYKE